MLIKNIIFDVTLNGGGDTFALAYILGLMTNDDIVLKMKNVKTDHEYKEIIKVDVNENSNFSDLDAYDNFNYYVLSSGFSYSCANDFVLYCNETGIAKTIGQKTGGGACSIFPFVTPCGSLIQASSLNGLYDKNNNLIEYGVDPLIQIEYGYNYDTNTLLNIINNK